MSDESLTYEQARDELGEIVKKLESGGSDLAQSMSLWGRGEKLATICQEHLSGARKKIAEAKQDADENAS